MSERKRVGASDSEERKEKKKEKKKGAGNARVCECAARQATGVPSTIVGSTVP